MIAWRGAFESIVRFGGGVRSCRGTLGPVVAIAAWMFVAIGCQSQTAIVLRVVTDMSQGPTQTLTAVAIDISNTSPHVYRRFELLGTMDAPFLPAEMRIVPSGSGSQSTITLSVTAFQGTNALYTRTIHATYHAGETWRLTVMLPDACTTQPGPCTETIGCVALGCDPMNADVWFAPYSDGPPQIAPADAGVTSDVFVPDANAPPNDRCPQVGIYPSVDISDGAAVTASLSTLAHDYILSCNLSYPQAHDAVYRITVPQDSDVQITAAAPSRPASETYVAFYGSVCAAHEERCADSGLSSSTTGFTMHALGAGTYWVIVQNSEAADVVVSATIVPTPSVPSYQATIDPPGATFIDACGMPASVTHIVANSVGDTAEIPASTIPFAVQLYGAPASDTLSICSNGWLSLQPTTSHTSSGSLPNTSVPNLTIAPYWTALVTSATGVCYAVTGTAPHRAFVVEWFDAAPCCTAAGMAYAGGFRFEAVIREEASASGNNVVDFAYQTLAGLAPRATVGLESADGTRADTEIVSSADVGAVLRWTANL